MKVSLIIPAYNEEKYIGRCLKSVNNQVIPADEVIVVNNNSIDKTAAIAKKLGAKVIKEKMQGMIYARNRGFNTAKYEIIARCDADAIVPRNWIKIIKKDFENPKVDGLSGPVYFYDSEILKSAKVTPSKILQKSFKALSKGHEHMVGPNMAITKKIWEKVKNKVFLDESIVQEDSDLSLNIASVGGYIELDPNLIVGISARRIIKNPKSFFLIYPTKVVKTFWINRENLKKSSYSGKILFRKKFQHGSSTNRNPVKLFWQIKK
ncbi:MAG: glycosyltransferase [Candidatus Microgenomates bacterium]|jgi:glycosyltransferase involved in cell wall biosynthesis